MITFVFEECGVWSEICFQEQVTLYMNTVSQYYSHSTLHIPHFTLTACRYSQLSTVRSALPLRYAKNYR